MRKGPLSKEDKQFIENNRNKPASEIATSLDRKEEIVSKYITTLPVVAPAIGSIVHEPTPIADTHMMSMMAKNKKFGAVVMTENASMVSDDIVKKRIENPKPKNIGKAHSCIHKIRGE